MGGSNEEGVMPREVIKNAGGPAGTSDNPLDLAVQLKWGPETHVQIATTNTDWTDGKGDQDGWFVDLDREGIQRLIRSLRKARDQVFGADE
jgi:hypothetical protein